MLTVCVLRERHVRSRSEQTGEAEASKTGEAEASKTGEAEASKRAKPKRAMMEPLSECKGESEANLARKTKRDQSGATQAKPKRAR